VPERLPDPVSARENALSFGKPPRETRHNGSKVGTSMPELFFRTAKSTDAIYNRVRDRVVSHELQGRAFIEEIWQDSAQYLDPDLAERAPSNGLVSAFWEIYLAHALRTHGVGLVPRSRRNPKLKGPDLFAESPNVWIEAVAARPGEGPDTLKWGEPLKVTRVPVDQFVLRLRTAIECKASQLKGHIAKGYVKSSHAIVIAVSGAMLPYRIEGQPIPYVVRAVLGVGNLVLEFERATMKNVGRSAEYHEEVKKLSAALVKTDLFLNDEYSHVSAVLYSPSCWVHHPETPGAEFTIVHNPRATNPLADGWLELGDEYWLDGSELRHTRHAVNNWQ
jgi:hypothetical protein